MPLKTTDNLSRADVSRCEQIAKIVAKLPDRKQENIYFFVKGIELAGVPKKDDKTKEENA